MNADKTHKTAKLGNQEEGEERATKQDLRMENTHWWGEESVKLMQQWPPHCFVY